jgi:hypothetical protein
MPVRLGPIEVNRLYLKVNCLRFINTGLQPGEIATHEPETV